MENYQKENEFTNNINNKQFTNKIVTEKKLNINKDEYNNNNNNEAFPKIQALQKEIINLKKLIEEKNKQIESLNEENKNNNLLILQKNINNENKIEKLNKKLELIKVRNEILTNSTNEKDNQIKELNNALLEYKQKLSSNEKTISFINQIKNNENNDNKDSNKIVNNNQKYEIELNNIKNSLNEYEIKNAKLIFENNVLNDKIKNMEKEKIEEIKIMETLHKKQIDNYDKNILQLNEKISELLKEEENNKNRNNLNINKKEDEFKNNILNELNKKDNKIKKLDEENYKLKKEIKQLNFKYEDLKIICDNKDKIIEKYELQLETIDKKSIGELNKLNKDNNDIDNNMDNKIYINILIKENEELKLGLKSMTEGINQANKLYNNKLNYFKKEIIIKNNEINEYKNKISS